MSTGQEVEVARGVVGFGRRDAVPGLKQEEFGFGPAFIEYPRGQRDDLR
jgi:hypothetical protein